MKRLFVLSIFCCALLWACPPLPHHTMYLYKIEYNSIGKAGSEYLLIEKYNLTYIKNQQDTITKPLKRRHYKALYRFFEEIRIDSLSSLEVPSKKFLADGSQATTLMITDASDQEYLTPTFDEDNPPIEVKELLKYLKALIKK